MKNRKKRKRNPEKEPEQIIRTFHSPDKKDIDSHFLFDWHEFIWLDPLNRCFLERQSDKEIKSHENDHASVEQIKNLIMQIVDLSYYESEKHEIDRPESSKKIDKDLHELILFNEWMSFHSKFFILANPFIDVLKPIHKLIKYFSASIAALHPAPAATTACR